MNNYFNRVVIKIKWRYYWRNQLVVSVLLFLLYPLFALYVCPYINQWFYHSTHWRVFELRYFLSFVVIPIIFVIFYYVWEADNLTKIFKIDSVDIRARFAIVLIPIILTFLSAFILVIHFNRLKYRVIYKENLSDIKEDKDNTDLYHVMYYFIDYENYQANHIYHEGGKNNQSSISTYIVCPIMNDPSEQKNGVNHKMWLGFFYHKSYSVFLSYNDPIIEDQKKQHIESFLSSRPIYYFTLSDWPNYSHYYDLVSTKTNGDTSILNQIQILVPSFEFYQEYNGRSIFLMAICFFSGSCFLVFLITFFKKLDINFLDDFHKGNT